MVLYFVLNSGDDIEFIANNAVVGLFKTIEEANKCIDTHTQQLNQIEEEINNPKDFIILEVEIAKEDL